MKLACYYQVAAKLNILRIFSIIAFGAAVLLLNGATSGAKEPADSAWIRFRGPNGTGLSDVKFPTSWTADDYLWRVKLPGLGHSSPIILGDKIFVTSGLTEDATRIIRCLRTSDGGLIWKKSFASQVLHRMSLLPTSQQYLV